MKIARTKQCRLHRPQLSQLIGFVWKTNSFFFKLELSSNDTHTHTITFELIVSHIDIISMWMIANTNSAVTKCNINVYGIKLIN